MSVRTRRHDLFLRFLYEANPKQKKRLIDLASADQLRALREVTMNLYMGLPPISERYKTKLKSYKRLFQSVSDRRVDNTRVKRVLKRHPEAITLILKPYLTDDGRRVRSRQKDDVRSPEEETSPGTPGHEGSVHEHARTD